MSPAQIIASLPEGRRQNAALVILEQNPGGNVIFWNQMRLKDYGQAGACVLDDLSAAPRLAAMLADMIWEG